MITFPSLKLSKTEHVDIPKPSELYKRLGYGSAGDKYSGKNYLRSDESKIEMAQNVMAEALEPAVEEKEE